MVVVLLSRLALFVAHDCNFGCLFVCLLVCLFVCSSADSAAANVDACFLILLVMVDSMCAARCGGCAYDILVGFFV